MRIKDTDSVVHWVNAQWVTLCGKSAYVGPYEVVQAGSVITCIVCLVNPRLTRVTHLAITEDGKRKQDQKGYYFSLCPVYGFEENPQRRIEIDEIDDENPTGWACDAYK